MPGNLDSWPELRPFTFRFVILSRSRPNSITTHLLLPQSTLVVPVSQVRDYAHYGMEIRAIPDERTGVSAVHNWIVSNFDEDVKVLLCDDLDGFLCSIGHKQRKLGAEEIEFVTRQTAACAIGARARIFCFNQRPDPRMIQRNDPFRFDKWAGGFLGYVGREKLWDENLKCKCDVDACLSSFLKDRIVWQDSRYSFTQNRDTKLGGNSQFKTKERVEAEKRYIEGKWKAHVSFGKYNSQESIKINIKRRQTIEKNG